MSAEQRKKLNCFRFASRPVQIRRRPSSGPLHQASIYPRECNGRDFDQKNRAPRYPAPKANRDFPFFSQQNDNSQEGKTAAQFHGQIHTIAGLHQPRSNEARATFPVSSTPGASQTPEGGSKCNYPSRSPHTRHPKLDDIIIWLSNIRGLSANFSSLVLRLASVPLPSIIILNETFINPDFADESSFSLSNYSSFRIDRIAHGGGSIVFIKANIPCIELSRYVCSAYELLWIRIKLLPVDLILCSCYNSDQNGVDIFCKLGEDLSRYQADFPCAKFLIAGDLNMHHPESVSYTHLTLPTILLV